MLQPDGDCSEHPASGLAAQVSVSDWSVKATGNCTIAYLARGREIVRQTIPRHKPAKWHSRRWLIFAPFNLIKTFIGGAGFHGIFPRFQITTAPGDFGAQILNAAGSVIAHLLAKKESA